MPQLQLRILDIGAPAVRLCDSCVLSVIMRGAGHSEELVYCNAMHQAAPLRVVACNRFQEDSEPPRHLAWMLHLGQQVPEDDEDLLADYPFEALK